MKNIFNLKIRILALIFGVSISFMPQHSIASDAIAECTVSGAGVITQVAGAGEGADANFDCFAQPSSQKVKFYKAMLCTSAYAAEVTDALGPNAFLATCTTIWENPAGDEINITEGITKPLGGTVTVTAGTYQTLYMEIDPTFKYRESAEFNADMTDNQDPPNTTREFCATNATSILTNADQDPTNVTCNFTSAALAAAGALETSVQINELNVGQDAAGRSLAMMQNVLEGTRRFSAALIHPTTHNLAAIVDDAANPAGTRLAAWMSNPITISAAQALNPNFTVTFSNRKGIATRSATENQIFGIHPGAFEISLSIE
jgi:hypothetical protein